MMQKINNDFLQFIRVIEGSLPQKNIITEINALNKTHGSILGTTGSHLSFVTALSAHNTGLPHLLILEDKEDAAYHLNDIENILKALDSDTRVFFFPRSFRHAYEADDSDNSNILLRAEVLNAINNNPRNTFIVTYPSAVFEMVANRKQLQKFTFNLNVNESVSLEFAVDMLFELGFERVDFVFEPGQFAVRGGIMDIYSYSNDYPYRVEFFGDSVDSIRSFDAVSQRSIKNHTSVSILPNIQNTEIIEIRDSLFAFLDGGAVCWIKNLNHCAEMIDLEYEKAVAAYDKNIDPNSPIKHLKPYELFIDKKKFIEQVNSLKVFEFSDHPDANFRVQYNIKPQPAFNKKFDLIYNNLIQNQKEHFENFVFSDNPKQIERIQNIFTDLSKEQKTDVETSEFALFHPIPIAIHEGFVDPDLKLVCYTDHQLFDRYHRFKLKEGYARKEAMTLKEIMGLNPGDFVTHIDHGVGRFAGLEKMEVNGKVQEAIRLVYKDNDLLYVSIHSLHRISKFSGKDGATPSLSRLGSNAWSKLKEKTKSKVKELAIDLIKLYADRRSKPGFSFSPDNYLQNELEASFIYEDTPDQLKATNDIKKDMERDYPMDRLICGDVGFGKTEVAIRGAFKAVCDSKQVVILVPTTILALQHYRTLRDRLKDFPCRVDYLNRFRSAKQQKEILASLEEGKIDIIIGTHKLLGKDVKFKDLGLLIIDEEQKFGVAAKEKIRSLKVDVDTLTLTATPIPRTLQFSLMGARDLSVINTPPPNRYPIKTHISPFSREVIAEAISYEIERGGQVFFVNNKIQNLNEIADMIRKLCPGAKVIVGHGQMDGDDLENVMTDFIDGQFDVLVSTTIIEAGLDIPNANTIIINDAHNFGLSDLHQMRGRVGRANKKAFCYLLAPPWSLLSDDARKRLKAIEQFSDLGSGFSIAMRDLDIRGAGNLLGGEQSGFITDIGYETYLKILNEAVDELKQNEFKDLYADQQNQEFVKDCVFESDLEILFPDAYISNVSERVLLYKNLDDIESEEDLIKFQEALIDRFGPLPLAAQQLLNTVRLRWLSRQIGFEKIILRSGRCTGYFVADAESEYYQSEQFTRVLEFIKHNPPGCKMQEMKNRLIITFDKVDSVLTAIEKLRKLVPELMEE